MATETRTVRGTAVALSSEFGGEKLPEGQHALTIVVDASVGAIVDLYEAAELKITKVVEDDE